MKGKAREVSVPRKELFVEAEVLIGQGGHGTGKTGNLVLNFSRQGKHREFCCNTGKILETQGKYILTDY